MEINGEVPTIFMFMGNKFTTTTKRDQTLRPVKLLFYTYLYVRASAAEDI